MSSECPTLPNGMSASKDSLQPIDHPHSETTIMSDAACSEELAHDSEVLDRNKKWSRNKRQAALDILLQEYKDIETMLETQLLAQRFTSTFSFFIFTFFIFQMHFGTGFISIFI